MVLSAFTIFIMVDYMVQEEEKEYVPKAKRPKRLQAQWLLILKSWLKHIALKVESTILQWKTRKKYRRRAHMARKYACHPVGHFHGRSLLAWSAVAMAATQANTPRHIMFDTDSSPIGIDNRCTACISHRIEDFVEPPTPTNRVIKGFGGSRMSNVQRGTIKWRWEDDNGQVHDHIIPDSYYAPHAGVRLLSPQHWLQNILTPREKANYLGSCITYHNKVIMKWPGHTRTIQLEPSSNVATF